MFFTSAHRVPFKVAACSALPLPRSSFHRPRRTSSSALVAHDTA